jgi:serine/threonine-protein kinase
MAQIGEIIDNKYKILEQIGKGGMSRVYLARDSRLNKQWAIKEIQRSGRDESMNEVVINSAIGEAEMVKALDHYNIPHINDIIEHDDSLFIVMDYVEGASLEKILKAEGPQPQSQVIKWGKQLCDALHYLHSQPKPIIYRDMKPANVMVKPDGDVKLIDFGIARTYKERNLSDTVALGTQGYAPPEQFGGGQTDPRSDIYALGTTLYHAVTGHGPSKGEAFYVAPIRDWNPDLSGGLEKIILKCTRQNPAERYQSCSELMYDLEHYREVDDAFIRRMKRKLRLFVVMVVMMMLFVGGGGTSLFLKSYYRETNYQEYIQTGDTASVKERKEENYLEAIRVEPLRADGYEKLIALYEADGLTQKEADALDDIMKGNHEQLSKQDFYPQLAYDIGIAYWYSYIYDDSADINVRTRVRAVTAMPWFKDASSMSDEGTKFKKIAKLYYEVARFHNEIELLERKLESAGQYGAYFENLKQIQAELSADADREDNVKYTLDSITMNSIYQYAVKFKKDGVSKEDMMLVYETAKSDIETIDDPTIREEVADIVVRAGQMIESAFRRVADETAS